MWRARRNDRRARRFSNTHRMHSAFNQSLVTCFPDAALALRREMLVTALFKYMAEIQEIEAGYAFKFRRSELLIRRIAEYIVFEGQHSPQLMFALIADPDGGALWLQIRGLETEKEHIRSAYATHHMRVSPPA